MPTDLFGDELRNGERLWTSVELADELGITVPRVRQLCLEGRFPGARKIGGHERGLWLVPESGFRYFAAHDRDRRYLQWKPKSKEAES
jgi:hypothetical protein